MASIVVAGDTSGTVTLSAPATAGTTTLTLPTTSGTIALTDGSATTFTSITDSGNLTFTGTGNRITGDFSNATIASRAMFQSSTTNGNTQLGAIPNGTATQAALQAYGGSDPDNAQRTVIQTIGGTESRLASTYKGTPASGTFLPLTFYTSDLERMRIDSSGNLYVAKTTTSDTTKGIQAQASGRLTSTMAESANGTDNLTVYSTGAAAYRFYVGMGGTIYATSTTITGISDQRVKENIVDLDEGLDAVMALKPRKFDWKEGKGKDIKGDRGFIAQEFETVFPDMIEEWKDPAPEGEEPYKSVNANLIPTLVKAIQELKAIVDAQQKRIETLESKA